VAEVTRRAILWLTLAGSSLGALTIGAGAQAPPPSTAPPRCRVTGRITSNGTPLPGASVVARAADAVRAVTSTDIDGSYTILFAPNATYSVSADFTGFASAARDLTLGAPPCDQTVDFALALASRRATTTPTNGAATTTPDATTAPPPAVPSTPPSATQQPAPQGGGRGQRQGQGQRFQTLNVQSNAAGAATLEAAPAESSQEVSQLLPPGFSAESSGGDAIAISGSADATNVNRGAMNGRLEAINAGQLDPFSGQFNGIGPGGPGGPGGPPGGFGRGGPGGPGGGGFFFGGRGGRGQENYRGSATYTFGGSALDSPPYQLRSNVPTTQPGFAQNNFGATFGGPLKIPGIYADKNRRTSFQVNYSGNQSSNVFDRYATVPTDAMRSGNFSASPITLIDPSTGQPFPGNQIPANRISLASNVLLPYIPSPNLPGTTQNYHVSTTATSSSQAVSLRVIQNLSPQVAQNPNTPGGGGGRGGGGGGGGGFGGGRFGGGGQGAQGGNRPTNITLTGQLQYRRNETQGLNVFPDLGGTTVNTSVAVPISLNVVHGRSVQIFNVNAVHSTAETSNAFANTTNVGAQAGIQFPGATDPLNWGPPNLTFSSGLTGVQSASATQRTDDRFSVGYTWLKTSQKHRLRAGGDFRYTASNADINQNARGTFTFTGLYSSGGATLTNPLAASAANFADFLLGMPQQASLQVGTTSRLRQQAYDLFLEDNWQKSSKLTFNLGLRYELTRPYVEANNRMSNLDATSNFSSVAQVLPGAIGPFTGSFPAGLLNTDTNNLGPRLGMAYRLKPSTILRAGYSITYNSGSYASIARQLVGQPPFADTVTVTGDEAAPLSIAEALIAPTPPTTNNWAVDKDYWVAIAGYTGVKGTNLDILRAPSLGAGGILDPGALPYIWESSGGHSQMNAGNFQLQKRLSHGYSGAISYTLARAMDNASSLGAGAPVVAQNDQDLAAEYARSNFDRRQQISGNIYFELPWGPNRRWLRNGGMLAELFGEWAAQFTLTIQSGTPLTARVLGAATDLLRGVNGSLRANYNGAPIALTDPTVDEFFNVTAFSTPLPGQYGDSGRNIITGPGTHQLNGLFQRDIRMGDNRSLTLQVNAINLLNTVQWAAVDTNINSTQFGQVISARPMRAITITARVRF